MGMHQALWTWVASRSDTMVTEGQLLLRIRIHSGLDDNGETLYYYLGRKLGNPRKLVFVETAGDDSSTLKICIADHGVMKFIGGHALCVKVCRLLEGFADIASKATVRDVKYEDITLAEVRACGFNDDDEVVLLPSARPCARKSSSTTLLEKLDAAGY